jgi:hypothetical protein
VSTDRTAQFWPTAPHADNHGTCAGRRCRRRTAARWPPNPLRRPMRSVERSATGRARPSAPGQGGLTAGACGSILAWPCDCCTPAPMASRRGASPPTTARSSRPTVAKGTRTRRTSGRWLTVSSAGTTRTPRRRSAVPGVDPAEVSPTERLLVRVTRRSDILLLSIRRLAHNCVAGAGHAGLGRRGSEMDQADLVRKVVE